PAVRGALHPFPPRRASDLMAVGSVPNTGGIGLEEAGVELNDSGHVRVNRVARTSVSNIYAVGDCTNFFPLASVASMQGRTAVFRSEEHTSALQSREKLVCR